MKIFEICEKLGAFVIFCIKDTGAAVIFLMKTFQAVFKKPFSPYLYFYQLKSIGWNSVFVIGLIGIFTGAVLAVQAEYTLSKFGATAFTGSAVALSLIRELGPVLTALMLIGRAGSAMTAELGIMKITEQIDALKSMAVDPMRFLIAPRVISGLFAMPMLTAIFIVLGIGGGYFVAVTLLGLSAGTFMSEMISAVELIDIWSGLIKSLVFGLVFAWVCAYRGYNSEFGAIGVNKATTKAVVTASVAILVIDYFLTSILTRVFMN